MKKKYAAVCCLLLLFNPAFSQSRINRFLTPADTFSKQRTYLVAGTWTGIYGITLVGLNLFWYKDYPHTTFHFFNDASEWLQMDKAGHVYTAYFESVATTNALQWGGVKQNKAACIGAVTGFVFQTTIEVFDGFSADWGASASDIISNAAGSSIALTQYLLWNDQRIQLKFSSHFPDYPDELSTRADDLFGNSLAERIIKDYNAQTYWVSVNPASFNKNSRSKFPKWLNIAVGYGAEGLLGASENAWEQNGEAIDRIDIVRKRQFYLSPDIDFTRIKTQSAFLKTCFFALNFIKVPAPALQINSSGELKFHALYF
jgi:Predicted periplasmic lipoprotein (DUF2279)